ncbi:hypothetical protein [Odoribacter lunatus]|uniref:hypothetical protein n=1 Tax=Odoribacter lunatus TaxID=2941335 RepID=UPI00203B10EF|nr:hypothetical protein [Odoribacter lunatus]
MVSEVLHIKSATDNKTNNTDIYNYNLDNIISCLRNALKQRFYDFPKVVEFPVPYQDKIFFSDKYLNFNSKFSKSLIKICSIIAFHNNSTLSDLENATLLDLANDIPFISRTFSEEESSISEINNSIATFFDKAFEYGIISAKEHFTISLNDFVPHSVLIDEKTNGCKFKSNLKERYLNQNRKWGTLIE